MVSNALFFERPYREIDANEFFKRQFQPGDVIGHLGLCMLTPENLDIYLYHPEWRAKKDRQIEQLPLTSFEHYAFNWIISDVSQIDRGLAQYPTTLAVYDFGNIFTDPSLFNLIFNQKDNLK